MSTNGSGVETDFCHRHLCAVWGDVCGIPMVWNNIPQHAPSTAIISLWLPDTGCGGGGRGGLSLLATGHTPLLLRVWCECAHESVLCVCVCPWGYTSCGGKWPIQSSPTFYLSTWVHAIITALWAGNHLRYGICNNSLAPFTLCWLLWRMTHESQSPCVMEKGIP